MLKYKLNSIKVFCLVTLIILILSCVTADKNKSEVQLNKDNLLSSTLVNQIYDFNGLHINLIVIDEKKGFFHNLINSISVDKRESAYDYLLSNYYVSYLSVENTTESKFTFDVNSLCIVVDNVDLRPIMKDDLPDRLNRFNVKGTMKNIYNAGAICAVTAAVVFVLVACSKHNCGSLPPINIHTGKMNKDFANELNETRETDPNKIFSSFMHKTDIQYNDLIDKETTLEPGQKLEGIVFFNKQNSIMDSLVKLFYHQQKKIELKKL